MSDQRPNGPNGPITDDEIRKLHELAAVQTVQTVPDQPPVISESLVERAPAEMPAIVRSMHHTAAEALDRAADHLEREMQSHIALMRDAANELRVQGDSQALTIEALSNLIKDTHGAFKAQADRLARFRAGEVA
jgi:hypothetical protein